MIERGECLACAKLSLCGKTSVKLVIAGYTCFTFEPVEEPVYLARVTMIQKYGEVSALCAMLQRPQSETNNEGVK